MTNPLSSSYSYFGEDPCPWLEIDETETEAKVYHSQHEGWEDPEDSEFPNTDRPLSPFPFFSLQDKEENSFLRKDSGFLNTGRLLNPSQFSSPSSPLAFSPVFATVTPSTTPLFDNCTREKTSQLSPKQKCTDELGNNNIKKRKINHRKVASEKVCRSAKALKPATTKNGEGDPESETTIRRQKYKEARERNKAKRLGMIEELNFLRKVVGDNDFLKKVIDENNFFRKTYAKEGDLGPLTANPIQRKNDDDEILTLKQNVEILEREKACLEQQLKQEKARLEEYLPQQKARLEEHLKEQKARIEEQIKQRGARFKQDLEQQKTRIEKQLDQAGKQLKQEKVHLKNERVSFENEKFHIKKQLEEVRRQLEQEKVLFGRQLEQEKVHLERLEQEKVHLERQLEQEKAHFKEQLDSEKALSLAKTDWIERMQKEYEELAGRKLRDFMRDLGALEKENENLKTQLEKVQ